MGALELGLLAAMCWGFHDVCVRFISQKTPISACIFIVLIVGLIFHICLMMPSKEISTITKAAFTYASIAGVSFVIASFSLYYAFKRGPVKLVAPLIASYPILSITWAIWIGTPVSKLQILAVLAIILGVSIVAIMSDNSEEEIPPIGKTLALSIVAAIAFACTFALGQAAAELSPHMSATLVTRIISILICAVIIYFAGLTYWPGKSAIPWLIAMGCADGLALWCVFSAGALENPQYASVTSSIFGLITILLAWIFLKERMTILQWTGCIITFLGVGYLAI